MGYFCCVVVVFEVYELCVDEGVVDVFVAEDLHDVEDVFGFVVFHCCFVVAECVEADLHESWVLEFVGDLFALSLEAFAHDVGVWCE